MAQALLESLARESDPLVLAAVLETLRLRRAWNDEIVRAVVPHLANPYGQIRVAAAQALAASRSKEAARPLVEAMETGQGRVREEARAALVAIAGADQGPTPEAWRAWLAKSRERPVGVAQTVVTFYGIPVVSRSFVIVMDRSGSMAEPGAYDDEEERRIETGLTAAAPRPAWLKPDPRMRKIDVAKYQVKKVLHYIENGSRFNLVSFSHRVQVYRPEGLTVMSDAARRAASAWVDALEPSGQTDIWQALQKALEFCVEPGSEGVPRKDGADTIYLMTDGAPEPLGLVMGTNAICDRMRDWNRLRKFLFNTVYVSASTDRDFDNGTAFMRRLALESGGACKVPKLVPSGAGR